MGWAMPQARGWWKPNPGVPRHVRRVMGGKTAPLEWLKLHARACCSRLPAQSTACPKIHLARHVSCM